LKKIGDIPKLKSLETQMVHAGKIIKLETRFNNWMVKYPSAASFQKNADAIRRQLIIDQDAISVYLDKVYAKDYPDHLTRTDMKNANDIWNRYKDVKWLDNA